MCSNKFGKGALFVADLFLLLLVLGLFGLAVYLFWKDRQMTRMEQLRIQKFRGSDLYAQMYPLLRRISRKDIESVRIRQEDVCITLMSQPGKGYRFDLLEMGLRPLSIAQMATVALALERDVEVLADRSRYRMRKEPRILINGTKTYQYTYVIKHHYKDAISRAPYYEKVA